MVIIFITQARGESETRGKNIHTDTFAPSYDEDYPPVISSVGIAGVALGYATWGSFIIFGMLLISCEEFFRRRREIDRQLRYIERIIRIEYHIDPAIWCNEFYEKERSEKNPKKMH